MLCVASAIDCPSPIIGTQHWLAATVENRGFGVPEILIPHLVRPARLLSISAPDRAGLIDMSLLILPLRRGMRLAWQLVNENASLLATMCVGWPVPTISLPTRRRSRGRGFGFPPMGVGSAAIAQHCAGALDTEVTHQKGRNRVALR